MHRRVAATVLLLVAAAASGACRPHTVDLGFRPDVGERYAYRYEIDAVVRQVVPGDEPDVTDIDTDLFVEQHVEALTDEGVRVAVELRSEGGAPRSVVVLLDRAGSLEGIELVERLPGPAPSFAAGAGALAIPERSLAPGERWHVGGPGAAGTAQLERLGVVDGADVAVVRAELTEEVDELLDAAGGAALRGTRSSDSTTSYDIADGAVRRSVSVSHAELTARIEPPEGVEAEPVDVTITYDVQVRVTRLR